MIYFMNPYAFDGNLFSAYDHYMSLLPKPTDWACFTDGDTAFLTRDYGHHIKEIVETYPNVGLFTSYASRCSYSCQRRKHVDMNKDSIIYYKDASDKCRKELRLSLKKLDRRIAGHLMLIKKSTWLEVRGTIQKRIAKKGKKILGVDTQISYAMLAHNKEIALMRGVLLFHYFRLKEGIAHKELLK